MSLLSDHPPRTARPVRLGIVILGMIAVVAGINIFPLLSAHPSDAGVALISAVMIAAYTGGHAAGLAAAIIATLDHAHRSAAMMSGGSASLMAMGTVPVALLAAAVITGNLKRRTEAQRNALVAAETGRNAEAAQRIAIETTLHETEARLRLVLANSPITLFAQDTALRYLWRHCGANHPPKQPKIGDTDADWMDAADAAAVMEIKRRVLQTGGGACFDERLSLNGKTHEFVVTVEPMRDTDGVIRGIIGASVEVTAERQAQAAARMSEARFRLALQHGPILMSSQDLDLRYTWVYGPRLGTEPEAMIGKTDEELYNAEGAAVLTSLKRRALETGVGTRQMVHVIYRGVFHAFDLIIEPLRDASGTTVGITCAAIDMTEEMERRVALEQARSVAERANQAKSRFFAAASHDLRQPFQAMRLFLHLLESRLKEPAHLDLAAKLGESLRAGEGLLSALLDISSLEAATVKPTVVSFPVQDMLRRMHDELAPQAAQKGLELRMVPCSARISSDPTLLERMLRNLIVNAIRYTQKGKVLIGCRPYAAGVRIVVWDTGPGIPPDKLSLIFEEFMQLDNAARDRSLGLGLGLAIVQRTGRLLGHKVDVRSTVGKGSCFWIEVPLASLAVQRIVRRVQPTSSEALRGARIAVIEDDRLQLMALKTMLEDWGCEAVTASSAAAALDALRTSGRAPDLVLSDFRLPGEVSGPQAIGAIRAEFGQNIPGLLVTGDTGADIKRRAGQDRLGVLHKPLHPHRLRAAMEMALAKSA